MREHSNGPVSTLSLLAALAFFGVMALMKWAA
jgi:hypothetical protein